MFEEVMRRAEAVAARRRADAIDRAAERARSAAPAEVAVEAAPEGVALSGLGLKRRFALEPALRWIVFR